MGRIFVWIGGGLAAVIVIALIAVNVSPVGRLYLWAGTGLVAKQNCSLVFVSGLDEERANALYITPLLGSAASLIHYEIDREDREVTAGVLGLFWRQRAVWRDGLGCTLVHGNADFDPSLTIETEAPLYFELDAAHRDEVAKTVRRVVDKLLHAPTVRVKQLASTPNGDHYAEALRELLDMGAKDAAIIRDGKVNAACMLGDLAPADDLMRMFNAAMVDRVMATTGLSDDIPIESKMVSRSIQSAQTSVEAQNFEMRKNVLKYDEVLNEQRKVVYRERQEILGAKDIKDQIRRMITDTVGAYVDGATSEGYAEDWDLDQLWTALKTLYPVGVDQKELTQENEFGEKVTDSMV